MESEQLIRGKVSSELHPDSNDNKTLDESVSEIDLYRYLQAAPDIHNFIFRIKHFIQKLGITDFSHVCFNYISEGLDPCGSHSEATAEKWAKAALHQYDLATRHLLINDTPIFRSTVCEYADAAPFDNDMFRNNRETTKFLADHGVLDVYNIPVVRENYKAVFAVTSHMCEPNKFREIVNKNLKELQTLAKIVDSIGWRKFKKKFHNPKFNPLVPVPSRPLQLLEVLANKDLTLNEAAGVLNISISTANQHIAAAKKGLGAHTTHGLILAAQKEGLILITR